MSRAFGIGDAGSWRAIDDCPGCGERLDTQDLDQMFTRIHDQEIEISECCYLGPLT
jgi:hypothetical protein